MNEQTVSYQVGSFASNKPSEDSHFVNRDSTFFGVFDGHNGKLVSEHLKNNLHNSFQYFMKYTKGNVIEAFDKSFKKVDEDFLKELNPASMLARSKRTTGSCGLVVHLNPVTGDLYAANVGDSRAILTTTSGEVEVLSEDQTVMNANERQKLTERTGDPRAFFQNSKESHHNPSAPERLLGHLMVTRAFGDAFLKVKKLSIPGFGSESHFPYLSVEPEVIQHKLVDEDQFLVLASDGLWDNLTNEQVATFLVERGREWETKNVAQALVDHVVQEVVAHRVGMSYDQLLLHPEIATFVDDITVLVVNLKKRCAK